MRNKFSTLELIDMQKIQQKKKQEKEDLNPFIMYTPLQGISAKYNRDKIFRDNFLNFISGAFDDDEMMFVKNFPKLYEQLPEPRVEYLKQIVKEKRNIRFCDDERRNTELQNQEIIEEMKKASIVSIKEDYSPETLKHIGNSNRVLLLNTFMC